MNNPLIYRRAYCACICGTVLLAGFFTGCAGEKAKPSSSAAHTPAQDSSVADKTPVATTDAAATAATQDQIPAITPETSQASTDTVTVGSCDGENTVTVAKEATGHALAEALMDQWLRDHPEANWVAEEKAKHTMQAPADNSELLQGEQGKGHTYGNYTERDILTWAREAEKFVAEGSRIFHSGGELGSTVGVSCDMCHPHAANTHPETYPKFQAQLGRVVLLRDMIEWCVENPVRGDHLDPNGSTMRALEAYIMAQRKGVAMDYGKH